jgi:magnesium transporter
MAKKKRKQPGARIQRIMRSEPPGAPPGHVSPPEGSPLPDIDIIAFGPDELVASKAYNLKDVIALRGRFPVLWVNVDGLGDVKLIEELGRAFGLHQLTLEDVVHVHQRAKVEYFKEYVFVVIRMITCEVTLESEQLGIVFGKDFVLTFQEGKPGDCLEPVRQRLRQSRGALRSLPPDYLAYALVDAVTDQYFPVLGRYADRLDGLEDEVLDQPYLDIIWQLHSIKRDLLLLQTSILPQRDLVHSLMRDPSALVGEETRLHLRDVADHTGQITDLITSYRDMAQALIEIHLNIASNRMNEVMQVLTIISAIFIPLTFIVGVYGMNFEPNSSPYNMPELRMRYGYPVTLLVMFTMAVSMLIYFRRRGWLRRPFQRKPPSRAG